MAPQADAVEENIPATAPMSWPNAVRSPVKDSTVYFSTQAMTQVYPMAMAREPSSGISPSASPGLRVPNRFSVHLPKAPTGPERVALPRANSVMTPEDAISTTKMK